MDPGTLTLVGAAILAALRIKRASTRPEPAPMPEPAPEPVYSSGRPPRIGGGLPRSVVQHEEDEDEDIRGIRERTEAIEKLKMFRQGAIDSGERPDVVGVARESGEATGST